MEYVNNVHDISFEIIFISLIPYFERDKTSYLYLMECYTFTGNIFRSIWEGNLNFMLNCSHNMLI
jgi:hypothetical protein